MALLGRPGALPFPGYFRGELEDPTPGAAQVRWVGRVTAGDDVELAWRASRAVHRALGRKGAPQADRRRALSILWARVDGVAREAFGPAEGSDLVLLLVARDTEGIALSGVGLGAIYAASPGQALRPWVVAPHPLLCEAGVPSRRPGAMTAEEAPDWLIAVARDEELSGRTDRLEAVLPRCGVHR